MRTWYSPADLAGLPGLPSSPSAVIRLAKRAGWTQRSREIGKGWEYHLDALPPETQRHLIAAAAAAESVFSVPAPAASQLCELADTPPALIDGRPERVVQPNADLADWQRQIRDARLVVLAYVDNLRGRLGEGAAIREVEAQAKAGTLPPEIAAAVQAANARGGASRALSRATLYRWAKERATAGVPALAPVPPPVHHRPLWLGPLLELYQHPNKPSVARCVRDLVKVWPADAPRPNARSAQRHIDGLPIEVREYGRRGARAMRAIKPFVRRTCDGLWPMDIVAVDGHSQRCYVLRPDSGRRIRPEVTTYIDLATRRIVSFSLWWAESQYSIWLALRRMVLDPEQGAPALQYSDNGAYRGAEHLGVLSRLGTEPTNARAYNPQANGAIETINRTVWRPAAKTQPTYCGKDADQDAFKKALARADQDGAGIADWTTWLQICESEVRDYNAREHDSLRDGRQRLSPDTAWARAVEEGWRPTLIDGDDLHDLLPAATRKVLRGEVSLPWGKYFAHALAPYHGVEARVSYDPADGSRVWVCDRLGRVIAIAERGANARPFVPADALEHARAQREAARIQRLERRIHSVEQQERPALLGEVIDLPDLVLQPAAVPVAFPDAQEAREVLAALEHTPDPIDRLTTDPERYEHWRVLRQREGRGELLSPREQAFVDAFGRSDYCRLMQAMQAQFDQDLNAASRTPDAQ